MWIIRGCLRSPILGYFWQRLSQGYGKSRAFGCGLMLIKPRAEA
ncbi:type I-E CRISPR-associated protein Cas6/Cse3/CasE [Escherichia coli]